LVQNRKKKALMTQEEADMEEVCRLAAEGEKVTDPALLKRIQELTERIKAASGRNFSLGAEVIPDRRGPIDEDGRRELTLDQMDLLRRGDARLVDPETGEEYVLVPVAEYRRLTGQ
jgi:hypothetical protein